MFIMNRIILNVRLIHQKTASLIDYEKFVRLYRKCPATNSQLDKLIRMIIFLNDIEDIRKEENRSGDKSWEIAISDEYDSLRLKFCERALPFLVSTCYEPNSKFSIELRPGVGGQESMIFAYELYRMYKQYVRYRGYELLDPLVPVVRLLESLM
ncbi:hypothetical protein ACOME3_006938 [Neoechinorhynchus agilis]